MNDRKLFISYSSRDADRVAAAVEELRRRNLSVWFDQQDIQPSDDIVRSIDEGLRTAKYFIVFASHEYVRSEWTRAEYSASLYAATNANERHVIAVLLDDVELPPLLAARRAILWTTPSGTAEKIAAAIERLDAGSSASAPMAPHTAPVHLRWEDVRNEVLDVLLNELLMHYGDILGRAGPFISWPVPITPEKTLVLQVSKAVAQNEDLIEDLRAEREKSRIAKYMVNELSIKLLAGGLAVMEPAFKLAVESNQQKLDASRRVLREQLAALVPRILVTG